MPKLKHPAGDDIDKAVGLRVKLRRRLLGLTQEAVAEKLDITFQQIQKYENGENRLVASYLYQLALVLGVRIDYFFSDLPLPVDAAPGNINGVVPLASAEAVSQQGLRLMRAFSRLDDARTRGSVADLIEQMADAQPKARSNAKPKSKS